MFFCSMELTFFVDIQWIVCVVYNSSLNMLFES